MSNYPPGVTGNEYEIAGWPEREETRDVVCGYEGTYSPCDFIAGDWECDFEGSVKGTLFGDRFSVCEFCWSCPSCGNDRETVVTP